MIVLMSPNAASAVQDNQIVEKNPNTNGNINTVDMSLNGPYHNLDAGAAGYDIVANSVGDGSGDATVLKEEETHVVALTSDGQIAVDSWFKSEYPRELESLSGKGWTDVVVGGISHYDRSESDSFNSSSDPKGFWLAALDSTGFIHVSPTFNLFSGELPADSGPFNSIVAVQSGLESNTPEIIGIDKNGGLHFPLNRTPDTDLKLKLKYRTLSVVGGYPGVFGVTTDGRFPCPILQKYGDCDWHQSIGSYADPSSNGPFLDAAAYAPTGDTSGAYVDRVLLQNNGMLMGTMLGPYKEIAGAPLGNSRSSLFMITGNPATPMITSMPSTGVFSGNLHGGLMVLGITLIGVTSEGIRRLWARGSY